MFIPMVRVVRTREMVSSTTLPPAFRFVLTFALTIYPSQLTHGILIAQRPVLIIMDRNEDLASSLHHPSTYQALVDDLLKIQMNRVKVTIKSSTADDGTTSIPERMVEKTYDLDVTSDKFFESHAGSLFPDAIDANETEMKIVTKKEEEIRARVSTPFVRCGAFVSNLTRHGCADGRKRCIDERHQRLGRCCGHAADARGEEEDARSAHEHLPRSV